MTTMPTAGARLRSAISRNQTIQAMAAHSPLSAMLAQEAGFEAVWASGFELSASYGLPDVSLVTMTQHLDVVRAMTARIETPIIADIDTGFGNAINVAHAIREYEKAGSAAVVMEDKSFPKVTSLIDGGRQELVRIAEFQGKIAAAVDARVNADFVVIARTEALIAGQGIPAALERAAAYVDAGADMILVHSKSKSPDEILEFIGRWDGRRPIVLVPTSYPNLSVARMAETGKVAIAIWGNHAIRASVKAMRETFTRIRRDGGIHSSEAAISSVAEIFDLQGMDAIKKFESIYLR